MQIKGNFHQLLETERLILSPWETTFAPKMYANWASDPEVTKFLTWQPHKNIEETTQIISKWITEPNYDWCILNKNLNNEPIGSISVVMRSDKNFSCEIGYCLSKQFWNNGFMTEAVKKVIDFLFEEGFCRIVIRHDPANIASGRVMQKAGLTFQGVEKASVYVNNKFCDCNVYYILNPKLYKE